MADVTVTGYAHVTETPFERRDSHGPYTEIFREGAFAESVAANPNVVLRVNHTGMPMASTYAGTLELWSDAKGLGFTAQVDDSRLDVADMLRAMRSGELRETSFAGRIKGKWSDDKTEFRVHEVDLDRGDVSPVTYGANPEGRVAIDDSRADTRSLNIRLRLADAA